MNLAARVGALLLFACMGFLHDCSAYAKLPSAGCDGSSNLQRASLHVLRAKRQRCRYRRETLKPVSVHLAAGSGSA